MLFLCYQGWMPLEERAMEACGVFVMFALFTNVQVEHQWRQRWQYICFLNSESQGDRDLPLSPVSGKTILLHSLSLPGSKMLHRLSCSSPQAVRETRLLQG